MQGEVGKRYAERGTQAEDERRVNFESSIHAPNDKAVNPIARVVVDLERDRAESRGLLCGAWYKYA